MCFPKIMPQSGVFSKFAGIELLSKFLCKFAYFKQMLIQRMGMPFIIFRMGN
ncbi:MAG: hypothetical protein MAGBODY4_01169 [Candidatus Marinimicrobia bacterium]|nr:hypothetical protein [Candidatus Neomarinimicrobiota bacterium]